MVYHVESMMSGLTLLWACFWICFRVACRIISNGVDCDGMLYCRLSVWAPKHYNHSRMLYRIYVSAAFFEVIRIMFVFRSCNVIFTQRNTFSETKRTILKHKLVEYKIIVYIPARCIVDVV